MSLGNHIFCFFVHHLVINWDQRWSTWLSLMFWLHVNLSVGTGFFFTEFNVHQVIHRFATRHILAALHEYLRIKPTALHEHTNWYYHIGCGTVYCSTYMHRCMYDVCMYIYILWEVYVCIYIYRDIYISSKWIVQVLYS